MLTERGISDLCTLVVLFSGLVDKVSGSVVFPIGITETGRIDHLTLSVPDIKEAWTDDAISRLASHLRRTSSLVSLSPGSRSRRPL